VTYRETRALVRNAPENPRCRALKRQQELDEGQAGVARYDLEHLVTTLMRVASAGLAEANAGRRRGSTAADMPWR
jgi:hypothetical protein